MITARRHSAILKLRTRIVLLLFFFCVVASTPRRIHAQTSKGILAGVIRDSTGASLPNATIVIINEDTAETRTVTSSDTGVLSCRSNQSRQLSRFM